MAVLWAVWQNWHLIVTGSATQTSYGGKMSKPSTIIIASALGFAAVLMITVIVVAMIPGNPGPSPDRIRLPRQALTPEEISVTAAPQPDGTLQVSQRLIFDAPDGEDRPIRWHLGREPIGRSTSGGTTSDYNVLPRVSAISARELSTAEGSTKDDPAEVAELNVRRDDVDVSDLFADDVSYEFANPNPPGENIMWDEGRHVIDVSYILDDVYLDVEGHELFVLPLRFPAGSSEARSIRTVSLKAGGPILCLPDNVSFDPNAECSALDEHRFGLDRSSLTWLDEVTGSINAIGFAAPDGMHSEPIRVVAD